MNRNLLILHCYCNAQFQNFSILLTWLSYSTTSKYCYETSTWNIFESVIPLNFLGEKVRKYVTVLVTMVSDITVLVSQNVIFFRYFMPMGHGVNKKSPPSASFPPSSTYQVFSRLVCSFTINT